MKRFVGIDYGLKRLGLAISDPFRSFALPLNKIENHKNPQITISTLLKALENKGEVEQFILGIPLHLDGAESEISLIVRKFAIELTKATSIEVVFIDERLTSKAAEQLLIQGDLSRKRRADLVDSVSATLILQTYLDRLASLLV